ncbi:GDP-L-fucose synthase [Muriicola jejuensis]|uniref:GDP-L-fucose synthase n=1 Tax=Muriicola jejuensis TaxID=504488 RepID=A0A6P0UET9_9FLAO|nr:GDP-L-fucose synthase [Muriicola jejuensis]NER11527.1 NAD-dependent epimerase/dehydratase family protein [Muriicola jejuensis]SMP20050.1 GDP-L-fucose synthase [Muriicola jejuensis]
MEKSSKIYVAGHRGLVGSAILKSLKEKGYANIVSRTHEELDLTDPMAVALFFQEENPEYVILAAAKVGGIVANNTYRADFIYENLMIQNNVIHQAYLNQVKKLLFLGSTCIYPRECPQPMKEEYLLTGPLEYTNEPYAIAKIAGIKMCESYNLQYGTNFISVMPTNLYGPNDNFDLEKSHVLPALIRKMHLGKLWMSGSIEELLNDLGSGTIEEARDFLGRFGITETSVEIWGTGNAMREFLWSEDMADACVFLMERRNFIDTYPKGQKEIRNTHLNIGTGEDISIKDLACLIKEIVGYEGTLKFNPDKPDGTYKKLTDVSKLNSLGWKYSMDLASGIERLYAWYLN